MLTDLRERRAKDEQVHCFQLGEFLVVGPLPTPEEEARFLLAHETTKRLRGSKRVDVTGQLGEPDEIVTGAERMTSQIWVCSTCSEMVVRGEPIPVPAPCKHCGGIAFRKTS
jgi:hypothetical protein